MPQPQVIPVTLTPQQATTGALFEVDQGGQRIALQIPPCRHGDEIRMTVGAAEVILKIQIDIFAGPGAQQPANPYGAPARTGPSAGSRARTAVIKTVLAVAVAGGLLLAMNLGDDDDSKNTGSDSPTTAASTPAASDPATDSPSPSESPAPDPYDQGTCLNGTLPDSETAQEVNDVEEVDCSASDAHYKVIQTFPMTSDLNECNANPKTQYAFSSQYTMNGAVISEYVYCLEGIGSYARS
ncbi:LppU/SCO3897 family protein [Streptomyces mesophilus]|uniref:LppU/SCO3897 family protein n=1 Tax=Streptomyces mesophilus TaxID=1775132 RepID=UPI003319DD8B